MFFIVVGVIAGIFIEQTYSLPNLRELMKCSKKYGEPEPEPAPIEHDDTDLDLDTDETAHTD